MVSSWRISFDSYTSICYTYGKIVYGVCLTMSDRWGYFVITLDQLMRKKGFDRDRLAHVANIQKTN